METKEERKVPPITQNRLKFAEQERIVFMLTVEKEVEKEDLLNPAFWGQIAVNFKPCSKIEVYRDDSAFYCELLVTSCDRTWAKVHVLSYVQLTKHIPTAVESPFKVEWAGPHAKFRVIRKEDKAVLVDKCITKEDALKWLKNYVKTIA